MSSSAVFEKLPAVPRAPTKLRGFHRGTPQQRGTQPIVATTKATGQVLSIRASALYSSRKFAENLSVVVRRRFFLTVRRTLAITAVELDTVFRAALIAFLCARGSTASAFAVLLSSTSSTSSLF